MHGVNEVHKHFVVHYKQNIMRHPMHHLPTVNITVPCPQGIKFKTHTELVAGTLWR